MQKVVGSNPISRFARKLGRSLPKQAMVESGVF
jgi:hypothetical protein